MAGLSSGLRPPLEGVQRPLSVHAGLWLDRFLPLQTWHHEGEPAGYKKDEARAAKDKLVENVTGLPLPEGYLAAYAEWERGLSSAAVAAATGAGEVKGRMVIGLGAKGPAEFGITLHHTWGVPIIPGSSLKGIAALGADRYLDNKAWRRREDHARAREGAPNAYDALFGDVEEQGAVIFHDAWLLPSTDGKIPLHRDVMTVHHPGYYQHTHGAQHQPEPSDTDSPIPVPFVTANGRYLIALELNPSLDPVEHAHWLRAAWTALQQGLQHHGIGSKTNAGYGRVALLDWEETIFGARQRARDEARRAHHAAAAADATRALLQDARQAMDVDGRANSVAETEGPPVLRAWLGAGPTGTAPLGLIGDEAQVKAAARALNDRRLAAGLLAETAADWKEWVELIIASKVKPPPPPSPLRPLEPDELEKVLRQCRDKKGVLDGDKAAKQLASRPLDAPSIQTAIEALRIAGAKGGHLKILEQKIPATNK